MPASPPEPGPPALADDKDLSDTEIEALLAREPDALAPQSHLQPPPLCTGVRQPGKGRWGLWIVLLLSLFSL